MVVLLVLAVFVLGASSAYAACSACAGKGGWQKTYDFFAKGPCKACASCKTDKKACSASAKKGTEVCVKN